VEDYARWSNSCKYSARDENIVCRIFLHLAFKI